MHAWFHIATATLSWVETATEKWGGGRDFSYHIAHKARHLGGGMPSQEIFGFWGLLEAIWCNLRFYVKILISSVE